jgi:hypothetical protein
MADHPPPTGLTADVDLNFVGHLTISHKLLPAHGEDPDPPLGLLIFDLHADPAADPDGLPAEITWDADNGQCIVSICGDYSVHDVLAGHLADLRAQLRQDTLAHRDGRVMGT